MSETETIRQVMVNGASVAVRTWPGDGPAVVAVHGLSSNSAFFVGVAERLAGRRPLHSVDLVGRGASDKPDAGYGIDRHARDVAAVVDALDIGPAVIVGHSMGAIVALAVAQTHPEVCAGVVLYDGGAHAFRAMGSDPEALTQFLESGKGIEGRLGRSFSSVSAYEHYWAGLDVFDPQSDRRWPAMYLTADVEPDGDGGVRACCRRVAVEADVADAVGRSADLTEPVTVPVMAIAAEFGLIDGDRPLVSDLALAAMAEDFPTFEAHRLSGANHYTIALDDPGAAKTADLMVRHAEVCGR